ncbi:DUF1476 domain-containing protein [Amaricoccus sp.]|uniref:DUF1476 domain-containing protein n=1 Tax=Amaricoccus sp. TaxID=1872485 RepID=UPI001B54A97E|nr:DUF1476 domain-containing protein [Amaricoccus sp.]MBP7002895.1 DUF1476 domain-containing protein [Amaricoccus sp.]
MSDSFKDRERGFENQFAHDLELQFRANARRNRLLGHWAAGLLGKTGEDEVRYALDVVREDFKDAGHEDVVRKLAADLGSLADEATIRAKMGEFLDVAKAQLMKETR